MSDTVNVIAFPGAPNLPLFVAKELGLFEKNGINVELTTTPNSVFQFEQLSLGAFDIGMTAFDNVVAYRHGQGPATLAGAKDFHAIMGATQIELSFVVAPHIKSYADLRGKSIALDALATGFAFVLYEMLARQGLSKDDVELVAVGATPQRWQSVKSGEHVGTLTIEPFTSVAQAAGFAALDTSSNVVHAYQGGIVVVSQNWAQQNRQQVNAYLNAYLSALEWTLDSANNTDAQRILLENMPAIKPAVAAAVMASLLSEKSGLTPNGAILRDGIETVLRLRSNYGGGEALSDIDTYLDLSFYQEVMQGR
ncbi:MAG: ABC-type nitrate/sulfonate/bicarbonate transport system substrate-binding protein [Gammaproteobacteria bacterium]|jgi:ABC-type nitrate/sulfonate/bicarbonate transport system substrate-binding protein